MSESNETVFVNTEIQSRGTIEADDLSKLYLELGKAYYQGGFEDPLPQLLPLFDKITRTINQQEQQEVMAKQLEEPRLPASLHCSGCGAKMSDNARFCAVCGMPVQEEVQRKVCRKCGGVLSEDALFCGSCGTPVENE